MAWVACIAPLSSCSRLYPPKTHRCPVRYLSETNGKRSAGPPSPILPPPPGPTRTIPSRPTSHTSRSRADPSPLSLSVGPRPSQVLVSSLHRQGLTSTRVLRVIREALNSCIALRCSIPQLCTQSGTTLIAPPITTISRVSDRLARRLGSIGSASSSLFPRTLQGRSGYRTPLP